MPRTRKKKSAELAEVGEGFSPEEEEMLAKLEKEAEAKVKGEASPAEEEQTSASESAPEETETPSEEKESKPETPETEEGEEEFSEEELARFKEKAQKRIRKLASKAKEVEKLRKELEDLKTQFELLRSGEPTFPVGQEVSEGLPWETPSEPREVTEEEYQKEVAQTAQKIVQAELARQRRLDRLEQDIKAVEEKYPELNPDSEEFDKELCDSIANWFKGLARSNPDLRLASFVDELMSLRAKGAEREKSKISAKIAKQAAEQAVSPTGAPKGKGDLTSLIESARTIEELEEAEKLLPRS